MPSLDDNYVPHALAKNDNKCCFKDSLQTYKHNLIHYYISDNIKICIVQSNLFNKCMFQMSWNNQFYTLCSIRVINMTAPHPKQLQKFIQWSSELI